MPSSYLRPHRLDDALAALAEGPRTVVAGGTDVYPALVGRPAELDVLDITGLGELRGLGLEGGALADRCADALGRGRQGRAAAAVRGLRQAAREVGGAQIQNAGTVGGNLCNASPAADGVPNLLALGASVELASVRGVASCRSRGSCSGTGGPRGSRTSC